MAERGSLMKAAEVLHTNQPALSRSLRRLERLVGAPLFVRSSKGLALTDLGRTLREPVQSLLDHADAVESQAHAQARRASGSLKVGAVDVFPMNAAIAQACQSLTVGDRAVVADVIGLFGAGSFYWGGVHGTWLWVDPTNDVVVGVIQQEDAGNATTRTPLPEARHPRDHAVHHLRRPDRPRPLTRNP